MFDIRYVAEDEHVELHVDGGGLDSDEVGNRETTVENVYGVKVWVRWHRREGTSSDVRMGESEIGAATHRDGAP